MIVALYFEDLETSEVVIKVIEITADSLQSQINKLEIEENLRFINDIWED